MVLEGAVLAFVIFILRVINYAISTLRLVMITRNMKFFAAAFAFLEAFIFVVVIANVVQNVTDGLNLFAYCLGASAGSYLGMFLEAQFVTSYRVVNIVTHDNGREMALKLREQGYGVTESHGEGRDGQVLMLRSVVLSKDVKRFLEITKSYDENAFISIEEARMVRHGWVRSLRGLPMN